MNNWGEIKKLAIVEADDFQTKYDRNGLGMLFYWKSIYPKFKITLFTIPNRTSDGMLRLMYLHRDWIELAVHGFDHESNFECWNWDYEKTKALMERVENHGELDMEWTYPSYTKFFKAPGWMITGEAIKDEAGTVIGGKYSGYPPSDELPIAKDKQVVYKALRDMNYIIFDRHYNKEARLSDGKIVCVDCQPDLIHFHTWNVPSSDKNQRNGFVDIEENFGPPWDNNTKFHFVSEAWREGLFKPCQE